MTEKTVQTIQFSDVDALIAILQGIRDANDDQILYLESETGIALDTVTLIEADDGTRFIRVS